MLNSIFRYAFSPLLMCCLAFVWIICTAATPLAADGALDLTFSGNGKAAVDFGGNEDRANDMMIQPDGKIVLAGYATMTAGTANPIELARYLPNGNLDTTFDTDGRVTLTTIYNDVIIYTVIYYFGDILVGGTGLNPGTGNRVMLIARFNSNGSVDTTFGTNGVAGIAFGSGPTATYGGTVYALALVSSQIYAVGQTVNDVGGFRADWAIVRLSSSGTLDGTFGTGGRVSTDFGGNQSEDAQAIAVLPSGKIIVAGNGNPANRDFALALYTSNGSLDTNFGGGDGKVTTDFGNATDELNDMKVQTDGKIVAAGSATIGQVNGFALARYNSDGTLDSSFDGDGKVLTDVRVNNGDEINEIVIQTNGKIVAAGSNSQLDFSLARYNLNGSLDPNFGTAGILFTDILSSSTDIANAIAIQADRKLVVAGTANNSGSDREFAVCRYISGSERTQFDYDGDRRSDISVFRPGDGNWYLQQSTAGFFGTNFGVSTDRIVPGDYDGDAKVDIAVYRPSDGTWYIRNSSNGTFTIAQFGIAEDLPVPADYDGDGAADLAVFRPSVGTWYIRYSADASFTASQFGISTDLPTAGDWDGDGKADIAVWRPSSRVWYRLLSSGAFSPQEQFGAPGDKIVPADYDGDGKLDLAVFRPSNNTWYIKKSTNSTFTILAFGSAGDIPVAGDYDGDSRADIAVFRPSTGFWYVVGSINGAFAISQWGQNGDRPTPAAFGN